MLHLSLAGNILRAIGGHPKLYDAKSIPRYPMNMAGRYPYLRLDLKRADKDHLKTFIAVGFFFLLGGFYFAYLTTQWTG